jgi:hypothetical protein
MNHSDRRITDFCLKFCPNPALAITLTALQQSRVYHSLITRERLEKSCFRVIKRINSICYSRRQRKKGYSIGAITVIEGFDGKKHLHAHLALSAPLGMNEDQFRIIVESEVAKDYWFDKQKDIKKYRDSGWIEYITKLGPEAIAPFCLFRAFPQG